jgi:hypothetical protein
LEQRFAGELELQKTRKPRGNVNRSLTTGNTLYATEKNMKESDHPGENPRYRRFWAALAVSVVVLLTVAAVWAYSSISLPFETLSKWDVDEASYKISTPALFVFASQSDVLQPLSGLQLPALVSQQLMAVDYRHSIAILALRGYGGAYPGVRVSWVGHQGKQVIVLIEFKNPSPWQGIPQMTGDPYHMVLIPRDNLEGELRFSLFVGLREVAATTRRLP